MIMSTEWETTTFRQRKNEVEKAMSKTGKGIPGRRKSKCQDYAIEKS